MDFGSIKNVGIAAVDFIVKEREQNGLYKNFIDFCERINGEAVNKKCVESLIKAGAFDNLRDTRATLMASFEGIIDSITNEEKKSLKGQVTMFDMVAEEDKNDIKYNLKETQEYSKKELLSMEKEMLGIYVSGHPLENLREQIIAQTTINSLKLININEENTEYKDGQSVVYAGIITSIKKKYTKKNTLMAFLTVEDLYGSCEIIVFDSCYQRAMNILMEENIVAIEGRLSIREDDSPKIVANNIKEFTNNKKSKKGLTIDITSLTEERKDKLRGAIKFFSGEKNNIQLNIKNGENLAPAGGIYLTEEIRKELEEIAGKERIIIEET